MLSECHDSLGHMGIDKTYQRLREKYNWRGLYKDVVKYVAQCVNCKSRNFRKDKVPLQGMDEVWVPFEKITIDTCGPYPVSYSGNKYLLSIIDMYAGWPELYPIPNKSAETVANIIINEIIPRHSCPRVLLSDNGTEFVNETVDYVCQHSKIAGIRTSKYHPSSNGKVKRIHRVWNDMVAKQIGGDSRAWDELVPAVLLALWTCIHDTTKHSAFYLMTGRDPVLPLDTLLLPRGNYMGE